MKTSKRIFIEEKGYENLRGELIDIVVVDGKIKFIYSSCERGEFYTCDIDDARRIENPYRKKKEE
jgi:hypothetical protein